MKGGWLVSSSAFKTLGPGGLPSRKLSFSRIPWLHRATRMFLELRLACDEEKLFRTARSSASVFVGDMLKLLSECFDSRPPVL